MSRRIGWWSLPLKSSWPSKRLVGSEQIDMSERQGSFVGGNEREIHR